jgi:alpha-mannosidase
VRFVARDLPPRSLRRYRVVAGEGPAAAAAQPALEVETGSAGITALRDRAGGADWMMSGCDYALGEVVYETIPGPLSREKLCDWRGVRRDCEFNRTRLRFGAPEVLSFPYGRGLRLIACDLPGSLRALTLDVVTYAGLPRLDLVYHMEKMSNTEAEALYVAFPMGVPTPDSRHPTRVFLDTPGAVMRPGVDQVPGTATDWHSVQHYFAVEGGGRTVVVASPDIPLVQVNGINTGQWQETLSPHNGLVMSWVMNNYWFTNFPATQGGTFTWRYSLQAFPGAFAAAAADPFARAVRQPLLVEVVR